MRTVRVRVGAGYDIHIGKGLLSRCGELSKNAVGVCKAAVVCDSNVSALYLRAVRESLLAAGFEVVTLSFPAGESSKNMKTLTQLLEFFAEKQLTRTDCVFALGGGVTGDLAGFAAGVYLRGIRFVQIPTTLLAAVDSSVGGKTAVDLPAGKNLAGAFWQPALVLCDPALLGTLPAAEFASGMAEVIKYAAIKDAAFYGKLNPVSDLEAVIARCVEIKRDVVSRDERDTGERQLLNFGHTFGHAVELLSNFALPHGHAVAIGMCMMARAAVKMGAADESVIAPLAEAVRAHALPDECPFGAEEVYNIMLSDKKRETGSISLIVPTAIGVCERRKMPVEEARKWIDAALEGGRK